MARTRPGSSATGSVERGHHPPSSRPRRDLVASIRSRGVEGADGEKMVARLPVTIMMAFPPVAGVSR
jgi:hypothetical protein